MTKQGDGPDNQPVNQAYLTGKGTYILILHLAQVHQVQVGSLGLYTLPDGYYAYAGSAQGAGGIAGRLKHHLAIAEKPHWHIDYLRRVMPVVEIWYGLVRREHDWAALLAALPDASIPVPRSGASDCRCASHLFRFAKKPKFRNFHDSVSLQFPEDEPLRLMPQVNHT